MRSILVSLLLLFPAAAWADWSTVADGTAKCTLLSEVQNACFYDFSDTTDPSCLDTIRCHQGMNIWLDPNEDGADAGTSVEIQLYDCSERSLGTSTHCQKILADTDGDGIVNDVTIDGKTSMRIGMDGVHAKFLCVDVTANGGSDDARITAECY